MLDVIRRNLGLKLFSVALAILLWAVISRGRGGQTMEASVGIPVELHNLPSDMEILEGEVTRVDVRLSGPRGILSRLGQRGLSIPIDLKDVGEGVTTFELFSADVPVPPEVSVTRISPATITLKLERTERILVAVEPVVQGRPARGFLASPATVLPDSVEVRGPRSLVGSLRSLRTTPVTVEGATGTVRREAGLVLPDDRLRLAQRYAVIVTVPVTPRGARSAVDGPAIGRPPAGPPPEEDTP